MEKKTGKRQGRPQEKRGAHKPADDAKKKGTDVRGAEKPRLRAGDLLELSVDRLDEDGYGVARHEGKNVFVAGALPAEKVVARVTHTGTRSIAAAAVKVLASSPARLRTPLCRSRECDGCPLVPMRYADQLAWKRELIAAEISRYPSLSHLQVPLPLPSPKSTGYRNSAKLVVAGRHSAPLIGMYRRGSHDIADPGACPVHAPLINRIAAAVKEGIRKGKVPVYDPRTRRGLLRYLVVRVSEAEGTAMAVFVTGEEGGYNEIHHLAKHLRQAVPEVRVTARNTNTSEGNVIFGEKGEQFLTKEHALVERLGEIKFLISPRSFFQVNSGGARILYETVREWSGLAGRERVLDLYCGIGGISLFLADIAGEVVGVEAVEEAVRDARKNAQLNGLRNCRFSAGDTTELLEDMREEGESFDLVVLNPPRKGCDEKALQGVAALEPSRIVYVSCSPVTLARDLDILSRLGYRAEEIRPVDMFPHTPHVENVVRLVRKDPAAERAGEGAKTRGTDGGGRKSSSIKKFDRRRREDVKETH